MTGLSLIDFIILQDNSNIAVTYIGEEGFGFMGLKNYNYKYLTQK